jgi:hypothetical protein
MVVILAMGIGLFAPPFGVGYYAACAIGRVSPDAAMRRIWPYLLAVLAVLAVLAGLVPVAAVPWFSVVFFSRRRARYTAAALLQAEPLLNRGFSVLLCPRRSETRRGTRWRSG